MIKLNQILIVEGKYDKLHLAELVDTLIIPTEGFCIFKDKEKIALLRQLTRQHGAVILTDSDSAGFLIRNRLKQLLQGLPVTHVYIPDIAGKEKRKSTPSAEGQLGVEGIPLPLLQQILTEAGVLYQQSGDIKGRITKTDFMLWGLSGGQDSAHKRQSLQKALNLPSRLSANTLLEVLCRLYTKEEIETIVTQMFP